MSDISEVSLYEYIASKHDPKEQTQAIKFVVDRGYKKPSNRNMLAYQLHDYVNKSSNKEQALHELVNSIHPDKELFAIEIKQPEEKKQNCSGGCPLNAAGDKTPAVSETKSAPVISEKITNTLIIAGTAILIASISIAVVVALKKN